MIPSAQDLIMLAFSAFSTLILPPPNFQDLLMSVSLQSWIPPSMPGQTAPLGSLAPGVPPAQPIGESVNPRPAPALNNTCGVNGDSGGASPHQYKVRNNSLLPDVVAAIQGCNFQLRSLFGHRRPPPQHAGSQPMYHLRGRCSNTCNPTYSHCQLIPSECETLYTFLNNQIVTPDIGRGASPATKSGSS